MVKRMLIEATHPEETRVVVLDGTRLEEFDVETSTKKQIKGNIYLAKVVRVEPSLQAAFVDYGGNRHGFLAFSEIHPDYYQIPVADRERLMAEVARQEEEEERRYTARREREAQRAAAIAAGGPVPGAELSAGEGAAEGQSSEAHDHHDHDLDHDHHDHGHEDHPDHDHGHDHSADHHDHAHDDAHDHDHGDAIPLAFIPPAITSTLSEDDDHHDDEHTEAAAEAEHTAEQPVEQAFTPPEAPTEVGGAAEAADGGSRSESSGESAGDDAPRASSKPSGVETVGGEEDEESADEKQRRRFVSSRHYKIQEVIKRRQIMLIQVVKEERGNKGAALTTFLSLAGRYCVLMPNSPRGGGVSRKITSAQDRRRLKAILGDLELPKNMAVILRTAGAERNKTEIKRDYEYLQRTWNSIREVTMTSRAPALIHEEASLIKRAIRDIYSRDIEEVWVEGEEGYKIGKDFMKMLTPSHAKKVQRYKDDIIPLFHRYQVESQMEAINSPTVQLRSGGSIVFAQTEALVAIDVNSGRATKERHIEETAYKTNMEAAEEIARQLRLRDLAGLIVIDFIDMEDNRNNHAVERRLKEALKVDRARIQVGRISHFGLLELSRQRLRPSLIEANFRVCSHCAGSGLVRSTESAAVYALRMLEEEGGRQRSSEVTITVHPDVALYLLNYKRDSLASIEARFRIRIFVLGDPSLVPPNIRLDRVKATRAIEDSPPREALRELPTPVIEPDAEDEEDIEADEAAEEPAQESRSREHRGPREGGRDGGREGHRDGGRDANRDANREGGRSEEGGRKRRRRRRRRGGEPRDGVPANNAPVAEFAAEGSAAAQPAEQWQDNSAEDAQGEEQGQQVARPGEGQQGAREDGKRGRRRGRRGGRRRRRGGEPGTQNGQNGTHSPVDGASQDGGSSEAWQADDNQSETQPAHQEPARHENEPPAFVAATAQSDTAERAPDGAGASAPSRFFRAIKDTWRRGDADGAGEASPAPPPPPAAETPSEPSGPPRKGWWKQDEK